MFKTEPLPQVVIVERGDLQIQNEEDVAKSASVNEWAQAVQQAKNKGIPAWGGEPTPIEQLAGVLKLGDYTLKDFELFYIVRTLLGPGPPKGIPQIINEFQHEFEIIDRSQLFTEAEFREYYRTKNCKVFDVAKLGENETWPVQDATLFTQKVAAATSTVRNARLGNRIADALNTYDRVLVVYGAGHQVEMSEALKKMLSTPTITECTSGP